MGEGTGVTADNGGLRYDAGKPPVHLLPQDALLELAKVYGKGAEKYAPRNWERGMDWSRCYASLMRHSFAFWSGENIDQESGLMHAAQMVWNAMALLTYQLRGIGVDDRHKIYNETLIGEVVRQMHAAATVGVPTDVSKCPSVFGHFDKESERLVPRHVKIPRDDILTETFGPLPEPREEPTHMPVDMPIGSYVEVRAGLRFKLRDTEEIWEVTVPFTTMGKFMAKCISDPAKKDQMMHLRAIGGVVMPLMHNIVIGSRVKLREDNLIYEVVRLSNVKAGEEPGWFEIKIPGDNAYMGRIKFDEIELVLAPEEKKSSYRCVHCHNDALPGQTTCAECK